MSDLNWDFPDGPRVSGKFPNTIFPCQNKIIFFCVLKPASFRKRAFKFFLNFFVYVYLFFYVFCNLLIFSRRDEGAAYCFRFSLFFSSSGNIQPLMAAPKISIGF